MSATSPVLESLSRVLGRVTTAELAVGIALFVGSILGSAVAVAVVLCRLPEDYLLRDNHAPAPRGQPAVVRIARTIGKNLLGALLVALGVVLSLPGVPGQGLLTILIGLMLLDLPGKQAMERRIFRRPAIFTSINRLRARFGRPPLLAPSAPSAGEG